MATIGIHLARDGLNRVSRQLLQLGDDCLDEVALYVDAVEVLLELRVGKLHTKRTYTAVMRAEHHKPQGATQRSKLKLNR